MKKTLVGLICACSVFAADAQTMCKHKNTYIASISKSTNGTSSTVTNAANKTWSATFPNYTITGNAACNEISGTANTVNTALYTTAGDQGTYCWCQMQTPLSSYWVFLDTYGTDSACASGCAGACATAIQSNATYRTAILNSIW
ncbi:MAG: hypothetical protein J5611_00795 [Alphaproteobacteria bacterium]|nr:hypothetical protein [Alphaproteobacteria bacterium]